MRIPLLPESEIIRLRRWVRDVENRLVRRINRVAESGEREHVFLFKTSADIPAATVAAGVITPGELKNVPFYRLGPGDGTLKEKAATEHLYNRNSTPIPAGDHFAIREHFTGRFFVVVEQSTQRTKIGKADADINPDTEGTVSIWRRGNDGADTATDTTENVDAHHDWVTNAQKISAGKEVILQQFADEGGIWRIVGAECE